MRWRILYCLSSCVALAAIECPVFKYPGLLASFTTCLFGILESLMCGVILVLCCLLSVVIARAPEDSNPFCTGELLSEGDQEPPPLPSHAVVLMDSYNYLVLLGDEVGSGAVWQQVDLDTNNLEGRGTEWSQNTNVPCRQAVTACGFEVGEQNNWLITQYISRRVNGTLLPQVSIQVVFELQGCSRVANCRRSFSIYRWDTSVENRTAARETGNYQQVMNGVVAVDDSSGSSLQNMTRDTNFDNEEEGFYIAIRDDTTCISIVRLIVFYNVCPGGLEELVDRPRTIAPPVGRGSQPVDVRAQCVEGASPLSGDAAMLQCIPGGTWSIVSGCVCNSGFNTSDDRRSCVESCEMGTYYSLSSERCLTCPDNSEGLVSGLTVCPCESGYYRAPNEEDEPCTTPPSAPTGVTEVERTADSITLSWGPPEDTGGRNDVTYLLCYQEENDDMTMVCVSKNETRGTITRLKPGVNYIITVMALNGVSDVVPVEERGNFTSETAPVTAFIPRMSQTPLIVGVVVSVLLVLAIITAIIILLVLLLYRLRFSDRVKAKYEPNELGPAIQIPVSKYRTYVDPTTYASPDEAIEEFAKEIEPKMLRLDAEIGAGEFGTVYRGIWKESPKKQLAVAIKTLKPGSSGRMRSDFLNEASIMGQFQHDNVIKLHGVVTRVDPAMIVMEFMDNGSLYSYLRKNDEKLNSQQLLKMVHGVCSGMEYLAAVGFVHRDLAARNVLVSRDETCKVADFGLSREVVDDEYNVQKGGKIPVRWTAPEAIYRRKFTSSSDVWSFGVLMWEVMTFAQHPYDDWDNQEVLDHLETGYRLEIPHNCPEPVYEIMLDCWHKELSCRPSFTDILKRLNALLNIESPPKRQPKKSRNSGTSAATNPLKCKSVEDWLSSVKMDRYIPHFEENGITSVNQLVHLTEPDLREMGITLAGHLHKLTQSIESGYMELKRISSISNQQ